MGFPYFIGEPDGIHVTCLDEPGNGEAVPAVGLPPPFAGISGN